LLPSLASTIANFREIIQFLDIVEEFRDLTLEEWNFRNIISSHLANLLEQQRIYWRQRGTINWAKLGDECTAFFHANATIRHRFNHIATLLDSSGIELSQHEAKAELLWNSFKERMGVSEYTHMYFDLPSILVQESNLSDLERPFSKEENDKMVADLPNNKSPGPDGFNGEFMKKCRPLIAQDFYKLCEDFYEGNVCLRSINSSYITLVPKTDSPSSVGDFRPISLLNSSLKLLTKLLAERLQKVILRLIHKNQYGFIKSRSIHDCLAWAFEYLHIGKKSRKELVILKLDFEKAFDKIEHQAILDILRQKGFGERWIGWIRDILGSGTSSVLLNSVPSKVFHCKRGLRQGDPLSPLLFVLAADLLQSLVNDLKNQGVLKLPIAERAGGDFPIVKYADDTLLILEACPDQLLALKNLLHSFAASTRLNVNYHKSVLVPLNASEERLDALCETLQCQKGSLPFTYLGLPLGTTKPNIEHFIPLVQKVEKRLTCTSTFLSQGGKLEMVNSVFSSSAIFFTGSLKLHKGVIKQLDKYRRHCLWRGADLNSNKPSKAAWPMVCVPKKHGGLGVLDLSLHNDAMLLKFLHKFFSKADIPWVKLVWDNYHHNGKLPGQIKRGSFWWRDVVKLMDKFKSFAVVSVGDGSTVIFWKDRWSGMIPAQQFPELFSFAKYPVDSFAAIAQRPHFLQNFFLPLSVQANDQLGVLLDRIADRPLLDAPDLWTYAWGNANFSTAKAYKLLVGHRPTHPLFLWIWSSRCQMKHKVFFWLLLKDRLSTRDILRRKHMELDSYTDLCLRRKVETVAHLFLRCNFAKAC
jgi:hypothetical protein